MNFILFMHPDIDTFEFHNFEAKKKKQINKNSLISWEMFEIQQLSMPVFILTSTFYISGELLPYSSESVTLMLSNIL